MGDLDTATIRHALEAARARGYQTVQVRQGETSFRAVLHPDAFDFAEPDFDDPSDPQESAPVQDVTAGVVGYLNEGKTKIKVGTEVSAGDVLFLISALGHPNEVTAPISGRITEILVTPGKPVEYGQAIAKIESPKAASPEEAEDDEAGA